MSPTSGRSISGRVVLMTGRRGRKLKSGQQRKVVQAKVPTPIFDTLLDEARRRGVPLSDYGAVLAVRGLNQDRLHVGLPAMAIPNYLAQASVPSVPLFDAGAGQIHLALALDLASMSAVEVPATSERKAVQAKLPPYLFDLVAGDAADRGLSLSDHGALLILRGFNEERSHAGLPGVALPEYLRDLNDRSRFAERQECLMAG